jgi:hypothetical protein
VAILKAPLAAPQLDNALLAAYRPLLLAPRYHLMRVVSQPDDNGLSMIPTADTIAVPQVQAVKGPRRLPIWVHMPRSIVIGFSTYS